MKRSSFGRIVRMRRKIIDTTRSTRLLVPDDLVTRRGIWCPWYKGQLRAVKNVK